MKLAFNNLNAQWELIKDDCIKHIDKLFENSDFILGGAVSDFEEDFATYIGCRYAVGVSNGTDALKLSAFSLNLKGRTGVIIPANTFVATILGLEQGFDGADFILTDCDDCHQMDISKLRVLVSQKRQEYDNLVIVPVHLYGYSCDMEAIEEIATEYDCLILEDASQSHGTLFKERKTGSFGKVSAFSLYPGKNLGAAGDAGIVTTNDENIYNRLKILRNLGSEGKHIHTERGCNHRLDTIQAIILKEKLNHLDDWNESRRKIVSHYETAIKNPLVTLPSTPPYCIPVHHIYPVLVENRGQFQKHLDAHNIQHGIHYPVLIEEMLMYKDLAMTNKLESRLNKKALNFSRKMVSLPIHPSMNVEEVEYMVNIINQY